MKETTNGTQMKTSRAQGGAFRYTAATGRGVGLNDQHRQHGVRVEAELTWQAENARCIALAGLTVRHVVGHWLCLSRSEPDPALLNGTFPLAA
jgi:hypothetical protein